MMSHLRIVFLLFFRNDTEALPRYSSGRFFEIVTETFTQSDIIIL